LFAASTMLLSNPFLTISQHWQNLGKICTSSGINHGDYLCCDESMGKKIRFYANSANCLRCCYHCFLFPFFSPFSPLQFVFDGEEERKSTLAWRVYQTQSRPEGYFLCVRVCEFSTLLSRWSVHTSYSAVLHQGVVGEGENGRRRCLPSIQRRSPRA